jgi:putative colanic acid biosynthesis UDP-glucose lipid carrier transferase
MPLAFKYFFFVADILLLNTAVQLSFLLAGAGPFLALATDNVYLLVYSNLVWFFLVLISTPYSITKGWAPSKIVRSQLTFMLVHLLVIVSLILLFGKAYSGAQVLSIYFIFVPVFFASRIVAFYLRKVFTDEVESRHYVLIGRNELAMEIRKFYLMNPEMNYQFVGYIEINDSNLNVQQIRDFCETREVHEIICCIRDLNEDRLQHLVQFGLDSLIKVRLVFRNLAAGGETLRTERYEKLPALDLVTVSMDAPLNQALKRVFDLLFSFLFCVSVLTWLFPIIAVLIAIDSRGPVLFVQLRSGKNNRPFKCFKFRTMIVNSVADTAQASKNDSRITTFGRFLRKTSIDELPQFINVLLGTMSVVGPRPHMLKHTEEYGKLIEKFMGRQYVKPGITGLAQCMGYRGETQNINDMENRVRLDRYYIENWTFWLDIKIIFLTIVSLIRGSDKAY